MKSLIDFESWWRVFLHPLTSVIQGELGKKSNTRTLIGIAAAAVIGLGLSWLVHLITGQSPQAYKGITSIWVAPDTLPPFASWTIIALLGVILGFFDFEIVLFIFARLLGGKGSFSAQSYAQSLFYAPLAVIQQVLAVTPVIGRPLFFLMAVYSLLPTTTSLKAAHGYSTWRAVITWLMPIVLNVVVVFVIVMELSSNAVR